MRTKNLKEFAVTFIRSKALLVWSFNPFTAKGIPIDEWDPLALDSKIYYYMASNSSAILGVLIS